jgi:Lecithin:cholesterol acyltransferase
MGVAVVIPGIMGSALYQPRSGGGRAYIWEENFAANYKRLLLNPTILNWSDRPASAELLENVRMSSVVPFAKRRLWQRMLEYLGDHEEFGREHRIVKAAYDWRGSLLDSAVGLVERIDGHIAEQLAGSPVSDVRLSVLTHSMGGVLVRCAIGLGLLDLDRVERIVHIGTPLAGAPDAFRAAYGDPGLPLLREMNHLIRGKRTHLFWEHLQGCVRTFPSLFELMPHPGQNFLLFSPVRRENPFDPRFTSYLPKERLESARSVQAALEEAERRLVAAGTAVYTIFTENHSQRTTDLDYRVRAIAAPEPTYEILELGASTRQGDGTVPMESARGSHASCKWKPLLNVTHASMCNDKKVTQVLGTIL